MLGQRAGAGALLLLVSYQSLAGRVHGQCTPGLSGDLCCESSDRPHSSAIGLRRRVARLNIRLLSARRRLAEWQAGRGEVRV
jgi:hypothetical protein